MRDLVTGELSLQYFAKRLAEGWKISSIEWRRESGGENVAAESSSLLYDQAVMPYGLRFTNDCLVQENPLEASVLLLILDQIVKEKRIQEIAGELNLQGYLTREGLPWSATDVFNLMPRLIETGPALLKSATWQQRRSAAQRGAKKTN